MSTRYEDETLSQKLMAELFGVDVRTVSEHLKNIFASHELTPEATIRKFRIVQQGLSGKSTGRWTSTTSTPSFLSATGSTPYLQRSSANGRAAFAIKGYVLDCQRMENGSFLGEDYF